VPTAWTRATGADELQKSENITRSAKEIAQQKQHTEINDVKTGINHTGSFGGGMSGLKPGLRSQNHQSCCDDKNDKIEEHIWVTVTCL
jgi:hypothetical protein